MLNSIFNYLIKFIEIIFRSVYLLFALALIILSSYYFGNTIIDGVTGGDTAYNFSVIYWFDHWFPKIPLWYPLQGGGVSIVYGYHFLAHLGTVLVSRASGLTLENSFQMLSFVSVLLVSLDPFEKSNSGFNRISFLLFIAYLMGMAYLLGILWRIYVLHIYSALI